MKNIYTCFTKHLVVLPIILTLSLFVLGCSKQNTDSQSAYININLPAIFNKPGNISSRAVDNSNNNITSIILTISQSTTEAALATIATIDLLKIEAQASSIKVPAKTPLTIVGTAYQNNILKFRGEITDIILQPGERKKLQLPLSSSLLIDIGIDNKPANGNTNKGIAFSRNNQYILFRSDSDNLVAGDINNGDDLFLRDISTNTTSNVNSDSTGAFSLTSEVFEADISADGLYVVFTSDSGEYDEFDTNNLQDVYLKNTLTNSITHISTGTDGELLETASINPQISDDGSIITYYNPGSAYNSGAGIYLYNRFNPLLLRVLSSSNNYKMSGDGNSIAYVDSDGYFAYYDILNEKTTIIDDNPGKLVFNVSQDGQYIIFSNSQTTADLLEKPSISARDVTKDTLEAGQVYLVKLADETYQHISSNDAGKKITGDLDNFPPNISNNGNFAVFSYNNRVYIKDITNNKLINLTKGNSVFISATGNKVGYNFENHLYIIDNPLYVEPVTPDTKPTVPSTVTATTSGNVISISWNAAENAGYYRIYQSHEVEIGEGESKTITNIYETTELSISADKNISPDTSFTFKVSAINKDGESLESEEVLIKSNMETTPPTIEDIDPPNNAINITPDTIISIMFSEALDTATVNSSSILITDNANISVKGDYVFADNTVIFTPLQTLRYGSEYRISVNNAIKDLAGNALQNLTTSSFTTLNLLNEGSIDQPINITLSEPYNGFVGNDKSFYLIENIETFQGKTTTVAWLDNESDAVDLQRNLLPFNNVESSPINCLRNICISNPGTPQLYLAVNSVDKRFGATYTIQSANAEIYVSTNEATNSAPVFLSSNGDKQYLLLGGLAADTYYHIAVSELVDANLTLRFLMSNLNECTLTESSSNKNLACESKTDSQGDLLIEISGDSNISNFSKILTVNKITETSNLVINTGTSNYLKFTGLSPNTPYGVSLAHIDAFQDVNYTLYTNTWSSQACSGILQYLDEINACVVISNDSGNINLLIKSSFTSGSETSNTKVSLAALNTGNLPLVSDSFSGNTFGPKIYTDNNLQFMELSGLTPDTEYSIKFQTSSVFPTNTILSFYNDNWTNLACQTRHTFDFAICETKSHSDGRILLTLNFPALEASSPNFTLTATPITATQTSLFNLALGSPNYALTPVHYLNISGFSPNIYGIGISNLTMSVAEAQPELKVYQNDWFTPACQTINIPSLGAVCLADLTTNSVNENSVTDLNIRLSDEINPIDIFPSTADLAALPIAITDITGNLPFIEPAIGSSPIPKMYKITNLPKYANREIVVSYGIQSSGETFYVLSGNLDAVLCEGLAINNSADKICTIQSLPSSELYIVMDLSNLQSSISYTINVQDPIISQP